jgi:hypothetical protein
MAGGEAASDGEAARARGFGEKPFRAGAVDEPRLDGFRLHYTPGRSRVGPSFAALRANVTTGDVRVEHRGEPKSGVERENALGPVGRRNQDH